MTGNGIRVIFAVLICAVWFGFLGEICAWGQEDSAAVGMQGFVPRWSIGTWWIMGFSEKSFAYRGSSSTDADALAPATYYRYEVVGEVSVGGEACYLVEVSYRSADSSWVAVSILTYSESLLRPVKVGDSLVETQGHGPYVYIQGDGNGCSVLRPAVPSFPLEQTEPPGARIDAQESGVTDVWEHVWSFMGHESIDTGGGWRAVQVVGEITVVNSTIVLSENKGKLEALSCPYYEVLIAHGGAGRYLTRQVWHRDLPWMLFCEDAVFPEKEDAMAAIDSATPVGPRHLYIERDDLSRIVPLFRAWLVESGGPSNR